tara:strand:- start:2 stop:664 length:663 start_codon:yes stop_codon:yes gene_type:complete
MSAIFLMLIGVLGFLLVSPVHSITGPEVIERMQKKFAKSETFSAKFEKRFYWAVLDKHLTQSGNIYTRKPGQFRVEVEGDLIIADGKSIWSYTKDNNQVIVSDYDTEFLTPWEILVDYSQTFDPVSVAQTKLSGQSCYTIVLKPQNETSTVEGQKVQWMKIWVDKKHWYLLQVEQIEPNEDLRTYILKDHRVDKKLNNELFFFDDIDGVDVIDRRSIDTN